MRFEVLAIGAWAAFALAGCQRAAAPAKSLVGATKIPTSADLNKETIIIARMGGKDAEDTLNIEIRPTNQVVAAHYRGQDKRPVAQDNLSVSAGQAERLRQMLWRLRPDDGAPAQKTIPLGCNYVYDAGFDWAVAYVREDRPADLVQFTLPYPEYCRTAAYTEARELIGAVVGALPRSTVVQRFPTGRFHPLGTYSS
jgi:hypothetical protein